MGNINERRSSQSNDVRGTNSGAKRLRKYHQREALSNRNERSPVPKRPRSIFSLPSRSPVHYHSPSLRSFSADQTNLLLDQDYDASSSSTEESPIFETQNQAHQLPCSSSSLPSSRTTMNPYQNLSFKRLSVTKSLDTLYEESSTSPPLTQSLDSVYPKDELSSSHHFVVRSKHITNTLSLQFSQLPANKTNCLPQSASCNTTFANEPKSFSKSSKIKRRLTTSFLSGSVSRLHLSHTTNSAIELYKKASRSITSLTKLYKTKCNHSFNINASSQSVNSHSFSNYKAVARGSSSSLKCTWPVPWLEAMFLPEFPTKSTITEKDFAVLNEIGSGAFGEVYRVCLKREPGVLFALKIQKKSEVLRRNATKQIKNEASIHKSLSNSEFIAKFYACWQSRTQLYTMLQYAMGYGDLFTLWRDYGPFEEDTLRVYAAEIAMAIDYIHSNEIIYRDLKLENVVLDLDGHIQLVDFGFAKRLADDDRTRTICGTLQYMAPEIARGDSYNKAVDWWSFGVLLHILLTNRYPFPNRGIMSHEELSFNDYSTPNCEPALGDLLNQLLCVNVERRLKRFSEIKSHPFFAAVNWSDAALKRLEPFANIEKLRRCPSCNLMYDRSGSELSGTDGEENWAAFDEHYEFDKNDYFGDRL